MKTTRQIAAELQQLLQTGDRAATLALIQELDEQADQEERLHAENEAYLDRLAKELEARECALPPAPEPPDELAGLFAGVEEVQPTLVTLRAMLQRAGLAVRIELGPVDPRCITLRVSGPLALHAALRELLAEAGPLAGMLRAGESN